VAKTVRRRAIPASQAEAWSVISDPHHLPRWWPETQRVENVTGSGEGMSWTQVLGTRRGRGVRADYTCTDWNEGSAFGFDQAIAGTPFEKHLRAQHVLISVTGGEGGSEVSIQRDLSLRGISRLGGPMMTRGGGRILERALERLEEILT
jgi:uncharacterized protein YndB with AHSA1/START domain